MINRWKTGGVAAILMACCIASEAGAQVPADDSAFARMYTSGQSAMAAGRYDEARAVFERLEKENPGVAVVHASLGLLCYKLGDFDCAVEEIRTAHKLKPQLPGLDALLSMSLAESGRYREALPGLEKTFRSGADLQVKRQTGLELARVYSNLSMDRQAAETALEMRDLYKNDPEVLYNAGKILGNSAYITMQSLFHDSSNSLWAHLAEAEAQESQGQYDEAIKNYRNVLEIDPHRVNIHFDMGRAYLAHWKMGYAAADLAAAEEEFAKEIKGNPGNADAAYELAGLRWKNGKTAEAQQLYESAIKSYPDFEEALVGLGGVLLDEQNASQAAPHLKRAVKLRPNDEVAWYRLAQAERILGDVQAQKQALAEFKKLHARPTIMRDKAASAGSSDAVTPQQLGAEEKPQ